MNELPAESDRQHLAAPLFALVVGMSLVVASFVWPHLVKGRGEWTKELALQHQSAAAELHRMSHKYSDIPLGTEDGDIPDELRRAKVEFFSLNRQLDAARHRSNHIAIALRIVGVGLLLPVAAMALRYYWSPARRADRPLKPLILTSDGGNQRG
jgi:hypothetical protein